jgi:hypothetical protein
MCCLTWYVFHVEITIKYNIIQCGLPDDEHKMFETCERQEEIVKVLF